MLNQQQQQATNIIQSGQNLVCNSRPGSGKSFLIVHNAKLLASKGKQILVTSFTNKSVDDLAGKLAGIANIDTMTGHKAGLATFPHRVKIQNWKSDITIRKAGKHQKLYKSFYDMLRGLMLEPTAENIEMIAGQFYKDIELKQVCKELSNGALWQELKSLAQDTKTIDLTDMIYLPAKNGYGRIKYDVVFVDEGQDMNLAQMVLLKSLGKQVVVVGDNYQALYLWRGAVNNAMDKWQELLNCNMIELPVTYRNGKNIVEYVNNELPDFPLIAHENNNVGNVIINGNLSDMPDKNYNEQMVIARTNKQLIEMAIPAWRNGLPINLHNQVFIKEVVSLINSVGATANCPDCNGKLECKSGNYGPYGKCPDCNKNYSKIKAKNWHNMLPLDAAQILKEMVDELENPDERDILDVAIAVCENVNTLDHIDNFLQSELCQANGILFITAHSGKGLERDHVLAITGNFPHARVQTGTAAYQQEFYALFVALTRARETLIIA